MIEYCFAQKITTQVDVCCPRCSLCMCWEMHAMIASHGIEEKMNTLKHKIDQDCSGRLARTDCRVSMQIPLIRSQTRSKLWAQRICPACQTAWSISSSLQSSVR